MSAFDEAVGRIALGADRFGEARRLVDQMTDEELLGCLDGDTACWPGLVDMVGGGYYEHTWPAARVERLGVPGIEFADGPRGCVIGPCTAFPVSMARGATFDPDLERRVGEAIGAELRASGATFTGAVCMNLLRHPAWGRAQETYGEDPHQVGEMAEAFAAGLGEHVIPCIKHFALNSMENARFEVDVTVGERALHEVYLPHFRRLAQMGVPAVMSAYNQVNGTYCGDHPELLTTILREEWGWQGIVISDFVAGLHDPAGSVTAGLNIEMPFRQQRAVHLAAALADGRLTRADVEERVTETVATLLGWARVIERAVEPEVICCADHRALAREAASAGMVLLHNDGILPARPETVSSVAVVGRLAATPNLGDGGSSDVRQPDVVTALAGIEAAYPEATVVHVSVDEVADSEVVATADVVVCVVGYTKDDEGEFIGSGEAAVSAVLPPAEHPVVGFPPGWAPPDGGPREPAMAAGGDRSRLGLVDDDLAVVETAVAVSDRVVVAVIAGSAVLAPWLERTAATLMCWYPGMEGGHALGDVLTGLVEPGGRLPFVLPRSADDLVEFDRDAPTADYGLFHGQWHLDRSGTAPHRPFGFGLGYTEFELGEARPTSADGVIAEVANRGDRAGSTVVQVYASVPDSEWERPVRRLVGFRRVTLEPGERREVDIPVDLTHLRIRHDGSWIEEDRPVALAVGLDAASTRPVSAA